MQICNCIQVLPVTCQNLWFLTSWCAHFQMARTNLHCDITDTDVLFHILCTFCVRQRIKQVSVFLYVLCTPHPSENAEPERPKGVMRPHSTQSSQASIPSDGSQAKDHKRKFPRLDFGIYGKATSSQSTSKTVPGDPSCLQIICGPWPGFPRVPF